MVETEQVQRRLDSQNATENHFSWDNAGTHGWNLILQGREICKEIPEIVLTYHVCLKIRCSQNMTECWRWSKQWWLGWDCTWWAFGNIILLYINLNAMENTSSRTFGCFWTETIKVTTQLYVGSLRKKKKKNGVTERFSTAPQAKSIFPVWSSFSCSLVSKDPRTQGNFFTASIFLYQFQLLRLPICAGHSTLKDLIIITI